MRLTRRQELSLRDWGRAPTTFKHSPTPGKPAAPDLSPFALSAQETLVMNSWIEARQNGTPDTGRFAKVSDPLRAAMQLYESYLNGPDYQAWAHLDNASRDSQHRYFRADVHAQIDVGRVALVPISADPAGSGQNTSSSSVSSSSPSGPVNINKYGVSIAANYSVTVYNVPDGQDLYITDIDFELYVPDISGTPLHLLRVQMDGTDFKAWRSYAPQATATQQVVRVDKTLQTPIFVPANNPVGVLIDLISGTAAGAKASFNLSGFLA